MLRLPLRTRLERTFARLALGLPRPVMARLAGRPIERDGNLFDVQAQLTLVMQGLVQGPRAHPRVDEARALLEKNARVLALHPPALERVDDVHVPGPTGLLRARLYRPPGVGRRAPGLLFFHGGGFVVGSLDSHDDLCRVLAARARCVVMAVDYRLAPEHPFPAAVDDATAVLRWLLVNAEALGLDPARVAVGGDSAGGNLATVASRLTREDGARPCLQLLLYPVVDATSSSPSVTTFASGFFLDRATIDFYVARYLPAGTDPRDPCASPLFAPDLRGLPPALVITAGFDPLRDEGAAYAERLRAAGVPVEYRCYGSLFHGFLSTAGAIGAAARALDEVTASLATVLASPAGTATSTDRAPAAFAR